MAKITEYPAAAPLDGTEQTVIDQHGTTFSVTETARKNWIQGLFNSIYVGLANLASSSGSSLVGFIQSRTGAVPTTVQGKLQQLVSVVDWMTSAQYSDGQTGTPALNVASAFSLAAQNAPAQTDFLGNGPTTIVSAQTARIFVPAGKWTLGSLVNTGGRNIVWVLDAGAFITDYANLNGKIERGGQRVSGITNGLYDYGSTFSVITGSQGEVGAQIMGYSSASQLGTFNSRDSVSFYGSNTGLPAVVSITAANYTATTIVPTTPLTANQMALLRVGMIIDTAHSPTKYSGFITGWDTVGGTFITVSGWYLSPGPGTPATPTSVGTPGASVGPNTKIWGINYNVTLTPTSAATASSGFELGTINNQAAPASPGTTPICWGYDSVNLGTFKCDAAFIARNSWFYGFYSRGQDTGFRYDSGNGIGLMYAAGTGSVVKATDSLGNTTVDITNAAAQPAIELGNQNVANTPFVDLHSSGNVIDYDFRLIASGGTGVAGNGNLTLIGNTLALSCNSQLADNKKFLLGSTTPTLLMQVNAPTIASGFGTNPSIVHNNGTASFQINVGTGGTASSGVITFPAAGNGWMVMVSYNGASNNMNTYAVMTSTTQVTLTNQTSSTGVAVAWPASTILNCIAMAL